MKIRLLSDLHHEFFKSKSMFTETFMEYKNEDVLILAGDIAVGVGNVLDIIDAFLKAGFPKIIYVPGNHEYYGGSFNEFQTNLDILWPDYYQGKVYAFNDPKDCFCIIDGVVFCGGTLWTNFRENRIAELACGNRISDFKTIDSFTPQDAKKLYYNTLDAIDFTYKEFPEYKKVIVTHFLPAVECIHPIYRGTELINSYFANDLGEYISTLTNTTWVFGHTHDPVNIKIGETRLLANPHGYYGYETREEFDPHFQFEV
jgi:3',5'-cyclic AMP phosphodiesterase CpdA